MEVKLAQANVHAGSPVTYDRDCVFRAIGHSMANMAMAVSLFISLLMRYRYITEHSGDHAIVTVAACCSKGAISTTEPELPKSEYARVLSRTSSFLLPKALVL